MWCETMTSPERMGALIQGEKPDRVPVIPLIFGHTAIVCGQPLHKIFDDPAQSFRCQVLAQQMYGYDGGPLYAYASFGGWEMGGEIEFPIKKYAQAPVVARHPVETEDDVERLRVPTDVSRAGAVPIMLEFGRLQAKHGMPVSVQIGSPFNTAASVVGVDRMLTWMLKKPDLLHAVVAKVSEFLVRVAELFVKEFGAERIMAFHGMASETNKLISPKQVEEFAMPYMSSVNEKVMAMGVQSMIIHLCAEQNKNLKYWQQVPMPKRAILSFGREVQLTTAMEAFPDQIIAGNVDPSLIQEGQAEEVLEQARECVEMGKEHPGGYILMAGCEVPPLAPPANVFQLVRAAREFGRY
jgi:uroporphyrinogen decarboxylase